MSKENSDFLESAIKVYDPTAGREYHIDISKEFLARILGGSRPPKTNQSDLPNWNGPVPPCPDCNGRMTLRTGRSGPFFGCPNFPDCRGLVDFEEWKEKVQSVEEEPF